MQFLDPQLGCDAITKLALVPPPSSDRLQYGDFQTPDSLAQQACDLLAAQDLAPGSILEPTCGMGSFLFAARERFPAAGRVVGVEINPAYVQQAQERAAADGTVGVEIIRADFFDFDWPALIQSLPEPLLILGNPPWVTSAGITAAGGANLPEKSNFHNHVGIEAVTGKANFDISEWMLMQALGWMQGRRATLAMLCKTAVARKLLAYAWEHGICVRSADIYAVNAKKDFGAVVNACFLVLSTGEGQGGADTCRFHAGLESAGEPVEWGSRDGALVADAGKYERWKHLAGAGFYRWRSGIKHDCARVMELTETGEGLQNGLGERVLLEDDCLYPLLKSSDVAGVRASRGQRNPRWLLVPQRSTGEDTAAIAINAPRTWAYLTGHSDWFEKRKSAIYRNRPRFSIFGVGAYSFAPWKVVISGMYKTLHFQAVGPRQGKPVVFDDTCNFIPCKSQAEAELLAGLLNSVPAREFLEAFLFWDAKRPVTIDILKRLSLEALARALGMGEQIAACIAAWQSDLPG